MFQVREEKLGKVASLGDLSVVSSLNSVGGQTSGSSYEGREMGMLEVERGRKLVWMWLLEQMGLQLLGQRKFPGWHGELYLVDGWSLGWTESWKEVGVEL